jgi:uncharacterized membrane protein HdeD (DUF308 family)
MAGDDPKRTIIVSTAKAGKRERMPMIQLVARSLVYGSILLSVVSGTLSLFFYFSSHDDKLFIILTTAPVLSVIAGFIAIAVLAYESLKMRAVPTRVWTALALAFAAYWWSDFVLIDYASGYSVLQ